MLFHIDPLRLWVHKVLPVVYDDSLSYYEVLAKVTKKLNEVIDLTEEQNQYIEEFSTNLTNAINNWEDGMEREWSSYKSGLNNEWADFQRNTEQYIENWKNMAESDIEDAIATGINQFVSYFSDLTQTAVDAAEEAMRAAETAAEDAVDAVMPTLESQFDERYAWKTAVGSPLVATTAAGMTDTTKVYVYAGSETGYVNGDWYYYDGTAWQDGGVYNSAAVVTDPTLSQSGVPADAKATGDEITDLKSAITHNAKTIGFYNTDVKAVTTSKNYDHVIADMPISIDDAISFSIYVTGTFKYHVYYITSGGQSVSIASNQTGNHTYNLYNLTAKSVAKIRFYPFDVTVSGTVYITFSGKTNFKEITDTQSAGKITAYSVANIKARFPWRVGDMTSSGGETAATHRITTVSWQYTRQAIRIKGNGKVKVSLITADDSAGTNPVALGWVTTIYGKADYVIPAGTYFKMLVGKIQGEESTSDVITDIPSCDIFQWLLLEVDAVQKKLYAPTNPCVLSISHQGYSLTDRGLGDSRLSSVVGAYRNGFDEIETDIKFSSDNVPVLCHDSSFEDGTTGDTIVISQHTAAELQTYDYYGETISTLDDFMALSKMLGLAVWLDQLSDETTTTQWQAVFDIVTKYQMQRNVRWITMTEAVLNKIVTYDDKARFVFNASESQWVTYAISQATLHSNQNVIIAINYSGFTVADIQEIIPDLPENATLGIWTIDDRTIYTNYMPYVSEITSNRISAGMMMDTIADSYS